MRAVRPGPSPAVLWSAATAEASEVSRFSCMKCLGVSGVYDYAGLNRDSRLRLCPCCLPLDQQRRHPDLVFSKLDTQPTYSPVYASSYTSRCTTQNSGPSGSLLLPRKNFPFSASCRFIPAHWSPTLATQGWGVLNPFQVGFQNHQQSRVPHIWRALCARCGKPQISTPLHSGRDDKVDGAVDEVFAFLSVIPEGNLLYCGCSVCTIRIHPFFTCCHTLTASSDCILPPGKES